MSEQEGIGVDEDLQVDAYECLVLVCASLFYRAAKQRHALQVLRPACLTFGTAETR